MAECTNCKSFVTGAYARVFGTGSEVDGCPECGNNYGQHGVQI